MPFLCSTLLVIVSILVPIETPVADMCNGGGVDWDFSVERRYGGDVSANVEIRLWGRTALADCGAPCVGDCRAPFVYIVYNLTWRKQTERPACDFPWTPFNVRMRMVTAKHVRALLLCQFVTFVYIYLGRLFDLFLRISSAISIDYSKCKREYMGNNCSIELYYLEGSLKDTRVYNTNI
jgi:hypothetical protein